MITSTEIQGSTDPLSFTIQINTTQNKVWSAYDKTKFDAYFAKNYSNPNDFLLPQIAQKGEIICLGVENQGLVNGDFIGECLFALNETIPQLVFMEGSIVGEVVDNVYSLKLRGQIYNNFQILGQITGNILLYKTQDNQIDSGITLLTISYEDWERALLSPTTISVSDATYYNKESTLTSSYWWRESADKQLLILRDEILNLQNSTYFETATPSAIKTNYAPLIGVENVNLKAEDFKKLWKAYLSLIHFGATQWGYERALANFSIEPPVVRILNQGALSIGNSGIGTSKISGLLDKNTLLIDYTNSQLTTSSSTISWFLRFARPLDKKTVVKTLQNVEVVL